MRRMCRKVMKGNVERRKKGERKDSTRVVVNF